MQKKKRVLLVEDERDYCEALRIRLESSGYNVLEAADGVAGLEMARCHQPDLVILDLMLPKMSGLNVARLLKEDQSLKHIPIVMLTARAQSTDKQIGLALGADAYLTKPVDSGELVGTIEKLIADPS